MKKLITIFFLIGLFLQNFSAIVLEADYYLNKNFISVNFCQNRKDPTMHCNGKCYLVKKLKEQQNSQVPAPCNKKAMPDIKLFFSSREVQLLSIDENSATSGYTPYNILGTFSFSYPVFHPPTA